jgi:hypothetical protein
MTGYNMQKILMQKVKSTNIDAVSYDPNSKEAYILFNNGQLYKYLSVPEQKFVNLLTAKSIGTELRKSFRDVFPYEKCDLSRIRLEYLQ